MVLGEKNLAGLEVTQDGTTYDKNEDPAMTNEFATAAYRFVHSMIQGIIQRFRTDNQKLFDQYHLHDEFFEIRRYNSTLAGQLGMDQIIMGLVTQPAQTFDKEVICDTYISIKIHSFIFKYKSSYKIIANEILQNILNQSFFINSQSHD